MSRYVRDIRTSELPAPPTDSHGLLSWAASLVRALDRMYRRIAMWFDSLDTELDVDHLCHDNAVETVTVQWHFDGGFTCAATAHFTETGTNDSAWFEGTVRAKEDVLLPDGHTGIVFEDEHGSPTPSTYNITLSGGSTQLKIQPSGTPSDFGGLPCELTLGDATRPMTAHITGWLAHTGDRVGFFGTTATTKTAVNDLPAATAGSSYGSNEQTMLQDVYDKLNELLDALQTYGLV